MKALLSAILIAICLNLTGACSVRLDAGRTYAGLQNEDPSVRIQSIVRAGKSRDSSAVPYLVDRLTDSQSDVRFFAAIALKEITGQSMGWRHYDPPSKRTEAVDRWRDWLASRHGGATTSTEGGSTK